jgi:hypothetical protein
LEKKKQTLLGRGYEKIKDEKSNSIRLSGFDV